MKRNLLIAAATSAGLLLAGAAWSQGYGSGHGMMGGHDNDMMSGMGSGMMGPGMMGIGRGAHDFEGLDLTAEQRNKIEGIQHDLQTKQFKVMEQMHELMWQQRGVTAGGKFDEKALREAYDSRQALHKQMFENMLEARKRIDATLTTAQREKLGKRTGPG